jgi:hypothetical protein
VRVQDFDQISLGTAIIRPRARDRPTSGGIDGDSL